MNWIFLFRSFFNEQKENFTAAKSWKSRDERWKLKNKNSINIKYFPSTESLFVLCFFPNFFIATKSFRFTFSLRRSMKKEQRRTKRRQSDAMKRTKKKNKFHGIFLALLLKKNCFVYEFTIHKTFRSSRFCLLGSSLLKNNVFCVSEQF